MIDCSSPARTPRIGTGTGVVGPGRSLTQLPATSALPPPPLSDCQTLALELKRKQLEGALYATNFPPLTNPRCCTLGGQMLLVSGCQARVVSCTFASWPGWEEIPWVVAVIR